MVGRFLAMGMTKQIWYSEASTFKTRIEIIQLNYQH